jgi:hypothetical protein
MKLKANQRLIHRTRNGVTGIKTVIGKVKLLSGKTSPAGTNHYRKITITTEEDNFDGKERKLTLAIDDGRGREATIDISIGIVEQNDVLLIHSSRSLESIAQSAFPLKMFVMKETV